MSTRYLAALLLSGIALLLHPSAKAAESYDSCTGFIDSVPAVISTQGTWCMRNHLSTAAATGAAINVTANNVTIDCNGFRLGGLAAGDSTQANGIVAPNRQNLVVRNCNVRGFYNGVRIAGGAGHLIENNIFDNNVYIGIFVDSGENSVVRGNTIKATGGSPFTSAALAISATADVIDNTVDGVVPVPAAGQNYTFADGISVYAEGVEVRGNRVRGLVPQGIDGSSIGIAVASATARVSENHVAQASGTAGYGIQVGLFDGADQNTCFFNSVVNYDTGIFECSSEIGNLPAITPAFAAARSKSLQDARRVMQQRRQLYLGR